MNVINSLVDNYTKDELEHIVQTSNSMKQVIAKLGYKTQNGRNADTVKRKLDSYDISYDKFNANKGIKREYNDVFCANSTVTQAVLRKWYKKEFGDPSCCSICGQPTLWNGKSLTMILDHIDGDNHNNQENNLRWICPNCNSQLETFAGRNNRSKIINNGKIQYIMVIRSNNFIIYIIERFPVCRCIFRYIGPIVHFHIVAANIDIYRCSTDSNRKKNSHGNEVK